MMAASPAQVRSMSAAALAAMTDGAVLVDIRPLEQRIVEGEVPGAILIGRNAWQAAGPPTRPAQSIA